MSNIKSRCHTASWWMKSSGTRLEIFRVRYMMCKQTWSLREVDCQFERNFEHYWSKRRFPPRIFTSWRNFNEEASCSNGMSFKRPRTFDRIFTCTFDERSLERIMIFAVFRLHCFCKNTVKKLTLHQNAFHMHIWSHSTRHDSLQGSNTLITNIS